jgi:hypothetical protein
MINQKENTMIRRVFFLLALASAGVLLGASAVLAILNGNVGTVCRMCNNDAGSSSD